MGDKQKGRLRRWRSLSLKTLMIFVTLFALWLAWFVPRVQRQKNAIEKLTEAGALVVYDYQLVNPSFGQWFAFDHTKTPPFPRWLVDRFGIDCFCTAKLALTTTQFTFDDLSLLGELPELDYVSIGETAALSLKGLEKLDKLKALNFWSNSVQSFDGVENCFALERISATSPIQTLEGMRKLTKLKTIDLFMLNSNVMDLSPLSEMKNLIDLRLRGSIVHDLSPLKNLKQLESLCVPSQMVSDIEPIGDLHNLTYLSVRNYRAKDWTPLKKLKNLNHLQAGDSTFADLHQISELTKLISLECAPRSVDAVLDLSALKNLQSLERLTINDSKVKNPEALLELSSLMELDIRFSDGFSESFIYQLKRERPLLKIKL